MTTPTPKNRKSKRLPGPKALAGVAVLMVVVAAIYFVFFNAGPNGPAAGTTYKAVRGPLRVTVLEGGSIAAAKSLQLKSEVQGQTKILSIVEEGYLVTPEDVAKELVLVELDSKELLDRQTERELSYQRELADYLEAKEAFEIQRTQNQSDIAAAELKAKFGLLDFEKYMGSEAANEIVARTDVMNRVLSEPLAEMGGDAPEGEVAAEPLDEAPTTYTIGLNFAEYAKEELLGDGEARQLLRKAEDDYVLSQQELEAAKSQTDGTKRLFEKDFVTRLELEKDELALNRAEIKLASTETARDIYVRYEFPKMAEKLFSDYVEGLRALERVRRSASSKTAQAEAKLKSSEARYDLEKRKKQEIEEQIAKCVMRATQPGLVVYGDGGGDYWRDQDRIEEGSVVRERQVIITIPDNSVMTVEVKVHESEVKKVAIGQSATVRVDAYPGRPLQGEVTKISVLPDSQNRWMNPDLKVYNTTVRIDGLVDWLKPGMTAEAEILVNELKDVLQVPIQAVNPVANGHVVYVSTATGVRSQAVKVGEFNDTFIEIKEGLDEGQTVLLRAPDSGRNERNADGSPKRDDEGGERREGGERQGEGGGESSGKGEASAAAETAAPAAT